MGLGNTTRETILLEINAKSNKFRSSMDRMRQGLMKPIKNLKQFGQIMRAKKGDINSMSEKTKASLNPLGRFGVGLRKATHGMRGFRMEMLGVMFFGKMLQKTFTGLLRPIMEVFGIFDMFKTMLKVLFLPIMKVLFPFFLKLFKAVINMSPAMKKMIGWFVVAGVVIGTA